MIAATINPQMIILARESRGKTQSELADLSKVDQGDLSKIEKGLQKISEKQLNAICETLDYPVEFFHLETNFTQWSDFFYRKRLTMKAKEKSKIDAEIDVLRIVYDRLLSSIDIPEAKIPNLMPKEGLTPEDIANMTRQYYRISKGPLKDIISLLEKNGIAVISIDTDSLLFDGGTTYTEKGHPIILLNKNMPNDRKRFTLAHELGHQIMHVPFRFENELYDKLLKSDNDVFEKEADRFASELLMPSSEIISDLSGLTYRRLGMLKLYWNVSKKALIYKAHTLGCIDDKRYKWLLIELSKNGERIRESIDVDIDESKLFKQLLEAHKQELKYTNAELSKLLFISENDLRNLEQSHSTKRLRISM